MLKVADIMTPDPCTVGPDTPLSEVIRLMTERHCRQFPVVQAGRLVGIITDRDIRLVMNSPFILHERSDDQALLNHVTVDACMTPDPITIAADADARLAAELLRTHKYGGLPVLNGGKLVGIVTVSDVLSSFIDVLSALGVNALA